MSENLRWHRVHVRRVIAGNGEERPDRKIYCNAAARFMPLDDCAACDRFLALDRRDRTTFLICREPPHRDDVELQRVAATDDAPKLAALPVSEIMTVDAYCVRCDTSIETLIALFLERSFSGVPVVDDIGKPIGLVSKTDLVKLLEDRAINDAAVPMSVQTESGIQYELGPGFHAEELASATVADIMTPFAFSVNHQTSVAHAAALMSFEGIHRVPVVDDTGGVVGVLSSIDVMRWLGREAGYVIPSHVAESTEGVRSA